MSVIFNYIRSQSVIRTRNEINPTIIISYFIVRWDIIGTRMKIDTMIIVD